MTESKLPPLNALKAFEAAARHLSVKSAADELHVTPGAVSQMLKLLEAHLHVKLFERVNRGIRLTEAGRDYLPPIRNAFRQIGEASHRLANAADSGVLSISATPFFASAWLVPRLASFADAHPGIDLDLITSTALTDFSRDGVDAAIRHGLGRYPGLVSHHIVAVEMVPIAAPSLVRRLGMPRTPTELTHWPQVHDAERKGWSLWFEAQGIHDVGTPRGASFDDSSLLLKAVIAGQGAGLFPAAIVAEDIAKGRLVTLSSVTHIEAFAYYLVYPAANQDRPKIKAFRDWILAAAHPD